jgi:hypothetical protein
MVEKPPSYYNKIKINKNLSKLMKETLKMIAFAAIVISSIATQNVEMVATLLPIWWKHELLLEIIAGSFAVITLLIAGGKKTKQK